MFERGEEKLSDLKKFAFAYTRLVDQYCRESIVLLLFIDKLKQMYLYINISFSTITLNYKMNKKSLESTLLLLFHEVFSWKTYILLQSYYCFFSPKWSPNVVITFRWNDLDNVVRSPYYLNKTVHVVFRFIYMGCSMWSTCIKDILLFIVLTSSIMLLTSSQ